MRQAARDLEETTGSLRAWGALHRAFWGFHSLTWNGGVSPAEASRRTAEVVDWVKAYAEPGASILDVGCATGSHALAMVASGFSVTGIDISAAMVRRAKAKALRATGHLPPGASVQFARCNLEQTTSPEPGTYAVAACLGVLQCAHSPERFLRAVHRALAPGGVVLVEVKDRLGPVPSGKGHSLGSRLFAPLKRRASALEMVRAFSCPELKATLESAGFRVVGERNTPGWLRAAGRAV